MYLHYERLPACLPILYSYRPDIIFLEILLLLKEHREADDSPVDQQAPNYRHGHGWDGDEAAVG